MIFQSLSSMWTALSPGIGNHLWQSTLFAAVAGLLTLALRKNHARARYWLWLAASLKFLVPFSGLIVIGSRLSGWHAVEGSNKGFYFAIEGFIRPFPQAPVTQPASAMFLSGLANMLPALLVAGWLCGIVVVLFVWLVRYQKISSFLRHAQPLREGREVEALDRLASVGGVRKKIDIFLSPASLEPGIMGIARPALVWPEGISDRLEDAHLDAILAHEVWHVRRHDNLAAMVHMLVEAIFWFHPLVWWLGARLVEERERACDEEVLQSGSERQVYAESILKICEFCVGSPLACVAGVTGADLKKRIVHIMTKNVASKLNFSRKLLLGVAGVLSIAMPIIYGLARPAQGWAQSQNAAPNAALFNSAGVHISVTPGETGNGKIQTRIIYAPDGLKAKNQTLLELIKLAYGVQANQISGGPDWMATALFNIDVKLDDSFVAEIKKLTPEQHKTERDLMFQNLLADHFKLALHRENRLLPGYALVIAQNGPKVQPAKPGDTYPNGIKSPDGLPTGPHRFAFGSDGFVAQALPTSFIAERLATHLNQPVVDRTGLAGDYDFTLKWPQQSDPPVETSVHKNAQTGAKETTVHIGAASLIAAVEEQLGLKLDPQTIPLPVLVIDRAERPAAN
ncbi:MAG TPA: M56 family metallopeptidase [Candidatus Angelobacter sp.]|nr:M56 family metallopeptidase [Candidatus Angelobacter sp.]